MMVIGQPSVQWTRNLSGSPIHLDTLQSGNLLVVTSGGATILDHQGNSIVADSLWSVSASALTSSGNLLLTGNRDSAGTSIPYVRMLNNALQEIWRTDIPAYTTFKFTIKSVLKNNNGRIFLTGSAIDTTATSTILCYFGGLDTAGNIMWSFPYSIGTSDDYFVKSMLDLNGNLIVGNNVEQINPSTGEMHFRKYDDQGTFIYENLFYPLFAREIMTDIAIGVMNQTYLTGSFNLTAFMGNTLSVLALFDSSGLLSTYTPYDGYGYDEKQLLATDRNNAIYCTVTGTDYLVKRDRHFDLLKFDDAGNIKWQRRHDSLNTVYESATCIKVISNGGIIIGGSTKMDSLDYDNGLLVSCDSSGQINYETIYTSSGNDDIAFRNIVLINDSDFFVIGSKQNNTGLSESILLHYQSSTTGIENVSSALKEIQLYPNPCDNLISVNNVPFDVKATILNALGQEINSIQLMGTTRINTDFLASGIYTLAIRKDDFIVYKKFVKK